MAFRCSPTEPNPTHHVTLQDVDGNIVGLVAASELDANNEMLMHKSPADATAMKTSQGNTKYGDLQPPYYAVVQDDFSGGRGSKDFERDTTRFADAGGLNTRRPGFVVLGGQEQFAGVWSAAANALFPALRNGGMYQPESILFPFTPGTETKYATKIKPNTNGNYDEIWVYCYNATPAKYVQIELYDGAGANPTTPMATATAQARHDVDGTESLLSPGWLRFTISPAITVTSADGVWVVLDLAENLSSGNWLTTPLVALSEDIPGSVGRVFDGGAWQSWDAFPVRLVQTVNPEFSRFFEYKGALYFIQTIAGTVKLWINGERGVLSAGSTTTGTDGTKAFSTDELVQQVFRVIGGTGINEAQRWRIIASNTGTVITFETAYTNALAAGTEYVVLGSNRWTEITGHGLTRVTDILVASNGQVYFAQGSGTAIRRMREFTSAGVWTRTWAADGTNEADYLTEVGTDIWRARNSTGAVAYSVTPAVGVDFTFNADIPCGDPTSPFTNLEAYVDEAGVQCCFVLKEETAGPIKDRATFQPLRIDMRAVRSEKNGRAALVHNGELYFSLGSGLERYYYPNIDDIGPNKDEGLPTSRQGPVVAMAGYPGRFFLGIDAGKDGYSSVFSSGGWHEEWRGSPGRRLFDIFPQPIPGTALDRLWIASGGDLTWVPLPSETTNPLKDGSYPYAPGGYVETATLFTDLKTIQKYIARLKLFMEEVPGVFDVFYRIDAGAWTRLGTSMLTSSTAGNKLDGLVWKYRIVDNAAAPSYALEVYSLQLRIHLRTEDNTSTPVLRAAVLELLARIENKYSYEIPFRVDNPPRDLDGNLDHNQTIETVFKFLDAWSGSDQSLNAAPYSAGPLYMRSVNPDFDGKMVWLLPYNRSIASVDKTAGKRAYLCSLVVQDA